MIDWPRKFSARKKNKNKIKYTNVLLLHPREIIKGINEIRFSKQTISIESYSEKLSRDLKVFR